MNTFKHMIKSSWVVALSFCGCFSAGAGTFVDNFSAGLNPAYWTAFESSTGSFSVDASQGDVRFTKVGPNRTGGMDQIGMSLNLANLGGPVAGDFSAQLEFRNAQIPGPGLERPLSLWSGKRSFLCRTSTQGQRDSLQTRRRGRAGPGRS